MSLTIHQSRHFCGTQFKNVPRLSGESSGSHHFLLLDTNLMTQKAPCAVSSLLRFDILRDTMGFCELRKLGQASRCQSIQRETMV